MAFESWRKPKARVLRMTIAVFSRLHQNARERAGPRDGELVTRLDAWGLRGEVRGATEAGGPPTRKEAAVSHRAALWPGTGRRLRCLQAFQRPDGQSERAPLRPVVSLSKSEY